MATGAGRSTRAARRIGTVFAAHAALALAGARVHEHDLDTVAGLQDTLTTRDVIGQAKGILMGTRHVDADAAFELLMTASQAQNVKLRVIAEQVARTGDLPEHLE